MKNPKHLVILIAVFFILAIPNPTLQARLQQVELTQGKRAQINQVFSHFNHDTPGAALAIAYNGEIIYKQGYGMSNLEYDIPITPSSIFHVASVSKQFTDMSIVLLALEGKLSIDDDIRKHIPEIPDFGETIKIRHLVHHISGMRDQWTLFSMAGWRGDDVKTQWDVLEFVKRQKGLNFKPGDEYLYCNTGYSLLAEIVERVSGQSLREFADENIFKPLGMNNTHVHENHSHIVKNRTYAYAPIQDGGFRTSIPVFDTYGATSLFTTVEDLALWADNFRHKSVGGDSAVRQLLERGILNNGEKITYAFGLTHGTYRGLTTVGHGGSDAGYRAQFTMYPELGYSMIVLSNVSNGNPGRLARQVADIFFEGMLDEPTASPNPQNRQRPQEQSPPPALTVQKLMEYTGIYYSDELDVYYEFVIKDEKLYAKRRKFEDSELQTREADQFRLRGWTVQFTHDKNNIVDGFGLSAGRVRNLRFDKIN